MPIGKRTQVNELPRHLRVFLCHSSGDKPTVRILYRRLQAAGIDPWLDEEDLLPGQNWQQEIRKAVHISDVVIICLSRSSITKVGFVQKEITFALDVADEQPEGTIFLIPLRLEECESPSRLSHLHWVNLFEEKGFEKLMRALQTRASTLGILLKSTTAQTLQKVAPPIEQQTTPQLEESYWPAGIQQTGPLPVVSLYGREPFERTMPPTTIEIALPQAQQLAHDRPTPHKRKQITASQVTGALKQAQTFQAQGRFNDAIDLCEQILESGFDRPDARYFLGWLYQEQRRWDDAIRQFQMLLNDPDYALSCLYALGQCYRARGDMRRATTHFDEAVVRVNLDALTVEESDQLVQLCQEAAEAHRLLGEQDQALTVYNALLGILRSRGWNDKVAQVEFMLKQLQSTSV